MTRSKLGPWNLHYPRFEREMARTISTIDRAVSCRLLLILAEVVEHYELRLSAISEMNLDPWQKLCRAVDTY